MEKQKIIIIFDIRNIQEDYSKCMALIEGIERRSLREGDCSWQEIIKENKVSHVVLKGENASLMNSNGEGWNLKKVVPAIEKGRLGIEKLERYGVITNVINFAEIYDKDKEYYYYFRIQTYENGEKLDLRNVQYYFLLQQQLKDITKRICAFVLPEEGNYFEKIEQKEFSSVYFRYSHYTRWMNSYGSMYGVVYKDKKITFLPLSKKESGIQNNFFPLMEINDEMLRNMQRTFRLNLEDGKLVISNFANASLKRIVEICNRFLEETIKNSKRNGKREYKKEIQEWLVRESNRGSGISILELALFINLITQKAIIEADAMKKALYLVSNLNEGLLQLFENVIRHSENKKGIFSFDIREKENTFWRICVLDSNRRENIVDNFLGQEQVRESRLFKVKEDICLAHFFKDYGQVGNEEESVVEEWKRFREQNQISCLGLPHFADVLKSCEAEVNAVSYSGYGKVDERLFYLKNYGSFEDKNETKEQWNIPGTQFHIRCEIKFLEQYGYYADTPISMMGNLLQNDKIFVQFIEWESEEIVLEPVRFSLIQEMNVKENEWKMYLAEGWKNNINRILQTLQMAKKVYYIDAAKTLTLGDSFQIEALCKGIIDSDLLHHDWIRYFAFVNCTKEVMLSFYRTLMGSSVNICAELQLYFVTDDCMSELFLAGETPEAIASNAREFSFCRGTVPVLIGENGRNLRKKDAIYNRVSVCPFDVLIKMKLRDEQNVSVFERYVEGIADYKLTDVKNAGYKISDTHMRLGSKVHLHDFFEISQLFQKMAVAQKFAFLILQQIIDKVREEKVKILFYGYASYSRMILESLVELASGINSTGEFEFAVYQNDIYLQRTTEEISPMVKMYFSNPARNNGEMPKISDDTHIVQIVPISSTMTTFNKMWNTFEKNVTVCGDKEKQNIYKNITLLWVSEEGNVLPYWEEVKGNMIETSLIVPNPTFFVRKKTKWEEPLKCELCYPDDVMWEKPLVETDSTSTIPSQQLEVADIENSICVDTENEEKILGLRKDVYYGHVARETNHYQFYIDTAQYFQKEKENIKKWLSSLKEHEKKGTEENILHILAVPKHHTNVEFSYYVNNYYYEGKAHMLIVDSAKEFRSNFLAKYADIRELIRRADREKINVQIAYIDDNVITGSTFQRVNSLLHSLVPANMKKPIQCDKVFVLINRLSGMSKVNYVNRPEENFHSYVNVSISSIRTYGSSCVICNLKDEAKKFYKKSSVKVCADYWNSKATNYKIKPFDQIVQENNTVKGFYRFLCAHEAREFISKGSNKKAMMFSIIRIFEMLEPVAEETTPVFEELRKDKEQAICAFLKVLCRPFFSFGRVFKECILDFYLLLAEEFITAKWEEVSEEVRKERLKKKEYLVEEELWHRVIKVIGFIRKTITKEKEIEFVQDYILEGLGDLRSNYIVRKKTICNLIRFLYERDEIVSEKRVQIFYEQWSNLIYRLINGSADETKCLWLEVLLTFGEEYRYLRKDSRIKDVEVICQDMKITEKETKQFVKFWNNLLISNTRIYIENVEKCNSGEDAKTIWNDYYMDNLKKFLYVNNGKLEKETKDSEEKRCFEQMVDISIHLKKLDHSDVKEKYDQLRCMLCRLLRESDIGIFSENQSKEGEKDYYGISESENCRIENEIKEVMKKASQEELDSYGYFIDISGILLKFKYEDKGNWKTAPIYIYIQCSTEDKSKVIRNIRMILMFRYQFLQWIKEDFKSNAIQVMKRAEDSNKHLGVDRSGHHLSPTDMNSIRAELESTVSLGKDIDYDVRNWLLLKFYVNTRISKIYRSIWADENAEERRRAFLYYSGESEEEYQQELIKPLKTLEQLFWGEPQKKSRESKIQYSAESYLEIFAPIIEVTYKNRKIGSIKELKKKFENVQCISWNGAFYRREYMACMIMDILFSAIRCGFNWDLPYLENRVSERFLENDSRLHYWYLKNRPEEFHCKVDFSIENCEEAKGLSYLVIRNPVYLGTERDINLKNQKIELILGGETQNGISLYTIAWYVNNLSKDENMPKVRCNYEMKGKRTYFVIKLPIIKRG